MPVKITATYRIVTPMFIGDAEQNASGISPNSVKGALRFWWRALNWGRALKEAQDDEQIAKDGKEAAALRKLHTQEMMLFGGLPEIVKDEQTGKKEQLGGQGLFLLRVSHDPLISTGKSVVHPKFKDHDAARYLGYGLMVAYGRTDGTTQSGQLDRGCLNEDQEFTVTLLFRQAVDSSILTALVTWGLLGGLGSRSRHGMGSVALMSLKENGIEQWTAPTNEQSYAAHIKALFSTSISSSHTQPPFSAFWAQSRIDRLLSASNCYAALNDYGKAILMYRSWGKTDRGNRLSGGGVSEKRFEDDHNWYRVRGWAMNHTNFHPERVVFGLPHNYHQDSHHVTSEKHERRSSPLLFHVHSVGNKFIGISIYLPAQFLPIDEKIKANGVDVPANIDWSIITGFLDGKIGHPPASGAADRFPSKHPVLP